jgi:hypothetical protein
MMLLAATESRKWWLEDRSKRPEPEPAKEEPEPAKEEPAYPPDDGPLTDEQVEQLKQSVEAVGLPAGETIEKDSLFESSKVTDEILTFTTPTLATNPHLPGWMYPPPQFYTEHNIDHIPVVENQPPAVEPDLSVYDDERLVSKFDKQELGEQDDHDDHNDSELQKQAKKLWKHDNPTATLKDQRRLLARGIIDHLPWEDYYEDPRIIHEAKFGFEFPEDATKGDMFVNTISIPTRLFKYNGEKWIEVDKTKTDLYTYNSAYIDYLINRIGTGEYDPELLTESERAQIEQRLNPNT